MAKRTSTASVSASPARSSGFQTVARTTTPVTRQQVAARAYEIYLRRCRTRQAGDAVSDWLAAETELRCGDGT